MFQRGPSVNYMSTIQHAIEFNFPDWKNVEIIFNNIWLIWKPISKNISIVHNSDVY